MDRWFDTLESIEFDRSANHDEADARASVSVNAPVAATMRQWSVPIPLTGATAAPGAPHACTIS